MKDYEIRVYEKTKFIVIKYITINKSSKSSTDKEKKPNDDIMNKVWKLMKYTQGNNKSNLTMKFYMPVFVQIDRSVKNTPEDGTVDINLNDIEGKEIEVKIMVALPPEYQQNENDMNGVPKEPPSPNEDDIEFEIIEKFKCYVRYSSF